MENEEPNLKKLKFPVSTATKVQTQKKNFGIKK